MEKRNQENFEYCMRIAEELLAYQEGEIKDDSGEILSLWDWLSDVLDYEITIDSQMEYKSAKIYVTLGGPTVWLDTYTKTIELRWGNERAFCYIDSTVSDELDEYISELYRCR